MNLLRIKIYPFLCCLIFLASACADYNDLSDVNNGSKTIIRPIVQSLNVQNVTTRADNKDENETKINSLHLFIFGADGILLECVKPEYFQSYQFITTGTFMIDRNLFKDQTKAKTATVCVVGNASREEFLANGSNYGKITSIDKLRNYVLAYNKVMMPGEAGLPMYGEMQSDMSTSGGTNAFDITLKSLLSRVDLNITLNPEQLSQNLPVFTLKSWSLINYPKAAQINTTTGETLANGAITVGKLENVAPVGTATIVKGQTIKLGFYMPEQKCNPARTAPLNGYPAGISENQKQRFKPDLAKDKATYVLLDGTYTDVHSRTHRIKYKIYLGANHTNDFNILRNRQYKNNIAITGITNHRPDGTFDPGNTTISVDMRLDIVTDNVCVSMERETLLDSHIEVRPVDFYLANKPGSRVELEILNSETNTWMRLEKKGKTTDLNNYCSNGKRKYFTTDLLSKLGTTTTITSNTDNRIWLYFDENTDSDVDKYREGVLQMLYYEKSSDKTPTETVDYKFRQKALFPVNYKGREYKIEYYEEYLHNFDPKDNYGNTTDGMVWGLVDVKISYEDKAINFTGSWSGLTNWLVENVNPFYDFNNTDHPHYGVNYSQKLITKSNYLTLPLDQSPRSAAEYCYNKNKRDKNGNVVSMVWYLPGIDEIEDIAMGAYSSFAVFQDKFYWSSQPAYSNYDAEYNGIFITDRGTFLQDDLKRARATKVNYLSGSNTYQTVKSGATGTVAKTTIAALGLSSKTVSTGNTITYDPGNQPRTQVNRVRCVRKM